MSRLAILLGAFVVFSAAPWGVGRWRLAPPRWRLRLAGLALVGVALSTVTLLAAVLLPEVLVVSGFREIWETCTAALRAIRGDPLARIPSILAGAGLGIVFGRFLWSLVLGVRTTHRARVSGAGPWWRLAGGQPVYVLPLDHPEAYSVGYVRGQVVLSRGLLDILDQDERQAVLFHEEGHLRARHHLVLMMARAAAAALAPLPPARAALELLEQAAEEWADEYAATKLRSRAAVASGLSKAALAGLHSPAGTLSLGAGPDVPTRVRRLLDPSDVPGWVPFVCLLAVGLLVGLLVLTQAVAGLAVVAAAHHVVGFGAAATCPLNR